jgi:hypothetical protein
VRAAARATGPGSADEPDEVVDEVVGQLLGQDATTGVVVEHVDAAAPRHAGSGSVIVGTVPGPDLVADHHEGR